MLDDGTTLFDSRVIVEYVDSVSPAGRLIPEPARQRIAVKRWEALADGICDAVVALTLERRRPEAHRNAEWIERQAKKVALGLAECARELGERTWCNGESYGLADIAVGCVLGYLDLRQPENSLARRPPEPDAPRRPAREAAVVRGDGPADGVTRSEDGEPEACRRPRSPHHPFSPA